MTESEWNSCTDPQKMLEFLRGKASERKLRLFYAYCDPVGALPDSEQEDRMWRYEIRNIRDIVGNPFRPVAMNPEWLTSTVVSLAQAIYDERAFDRMPVLADALEESGCTSQAMLEHCRRENVHVRGCWLIDQGQLQLRR